MSSIVSASPLPLATAAQFQRRFPSLIKSGSASDPDELAQLMVEATAFIEDSTDRRLTPFTGHVFTDTLRGLNPDEYGDNADSPLDIYGSLGLSQANAFGTDDLVRNWWIDQTAPHYPELWTYDIASINLYLTFGNTIAVDPTSIEGPQKDTGHARFRLGTFAPEGTTIEVIYGGGYTVGIPPSLSRLCLYQAAKFVMLDMEPQDRDKHNFQEIDTQCLMLLANWSRS